MNVSRVVGALQNIMTEITPVIPFPMRLYANPYDVFLEVIIGEERLEDGKENDSICFRFNKNGEYGYAIYPDSVEYGYYNERPMVSSAYTLSDYTIDRIEACTCRVC